MKTENSHGSSLLFASRQSCKHGPQFLQRVTPGDEPRFTVHVLLLCIDRQDRANLSVCARSVLRSAYEHLHRGYLDWPEAHGEAMSTVLVAGWAVDNGGRGKPLGSRDRLVL